MTLSAASWRNRIPRSVVASDPESDADVIAAAERAASAEREEIQAARWDAVCPKRFPDCEWGLLRQPDDIVSKLQGWTENTKAGATHNLLILGDLGAGKTYCALVVARDLLLAGRSIHFRPEVELFDDLRPERGLDTRVFTDPDVLVIDDLGVSKVTEFTLDRLYLVLNKRWLDCKPTIVTTNLELPDLKEAIGQRTYDRLQHGSTGVRFAGDSRRRKNP